MLKIRNLFLLFFSVTLVLILVWFKQGHLLATGESGNPFYNISHSAYLIGNTWSPGLLGLPTSYILGNYFTFYLFSLFEFLNVPGNVIQALVFFSLIFIMQIFTFFLLRDTLFKGEKSQKRIIYLSGVLFYVCNLIALVSVWNRLQYTFLFFYALLPLGFYLFLKGIEERKFHYIIIFNLSLLLFVMAFASIPLLLLFWFILGTYLLFFSAVYWRNKKRVIVGWIFFCGTMGVWLVFNAWWVMQFFTTLTTTSFITTTAYVSSDNVRTLTVLSEKLGNLSYVFRLMHSDFLLGVKDVWGIAYAHPFFIIISYFIPFLAFFPLLQKKKPKIIYFFLGLSLTLVFLSKGSSGPFGELFLTVFSQIRFLEAFRNPFEKFSLALPFAYAPLIGYSLYVLYNLTRERWGKIKARFGLACTIILAFVILVFPLWNGLVFTSTFPPTNNHKVGYSVEVPAYYTEANNWLNQDKEEFRIIALPISGEGITYLWEYGYSGVELSNALFDKPFISFSTTTQFLENIVNQIQYTFLERPEDVGKMMGILNAKYIMTRSDIDYRSRGMMDPAIINNNLSNPESLLSSSVEFEKSFGKINFYKSKENLSKIYSAGTLYAASQDVAYTDIFSLTNFKLGDVILNTIDNPGIDKFINENTKEQFINPEMSFEYSPNSSISTEEARKYIPYIRFLPGTHGYQLIKLKEDMSLALINDNNELFFAYLLQNMKRLGEIEKLTQTGNTGLLPQAVNEYTRSIDSFKNFIMSGNQGLVNDNRETLAFQVQAQNVLLQELLQTSDGNTKQQITKAKNTLNDFAFSIYALPYNMPLLKDALTQNRKVYSFIVKEDGNYEVFMREDNFQNFYNDPGEKWIIQLNDRTIEKNIIRENGWVILGEMSLTKGLNEIHFSLPESKNLVEFSSLEEGVKVESTNEAVIKKYKINNFDPYGQYRLSFDYWIEKGAAVEIQLTSDVDEITQKGGSPVWKRAITTGGYNNGWEKRSFVFQPNPSSTKGELSFVVNPYNDCESLNDENFLMRKQCEVKSFHDLFNKPTTLWLKNLKVERVFTNNVLLKKVNTFYNEKDKQPEISFEKIHPGKYTVSIKNAQDPFFLIFSESFHPSWEARFADGKKIKENYHLLANSYSNGWYITQKGDYRMVLEFSTEKSYTVGKWITFLSIIIGIGYLLSLTIRKRKK